MLSSEDWGLPNLSSQAYFPFLMSLSHLAGLPPAPWSGGVIASLLTTRTSINFSQHHKVYSTWLLIRQRPERSSMRSCDPWPIALGHAYATLHFKVSRPITPAVAPHYQFVSLRWFSQQLEVLPLTQTFFRSLVVYLHGFLFLARGTTLSLHTLLCFVF